MATRVFSASIIRSYASVSIKSPSSSLLSLSSLSRLRPITAVAVNFTRISPVPSTLRCFATGKPTSSHPDAITDWSTSVPREEVVLDGCDYEHWLVIMKKPEGEPSRDEIIDFFVKTLAAVVGSEEEARMKIYSVSTKHQYAFGAHISEELSYKLKGLEKVQWVLPDFYVDIENKRYGGEPFINGQAVPYDPKYIEELVRPRNSKRRRDITQQN